MIGKEACIFWGGLSSILAVSHDFWGSSHPGIAALISGKTSQIKSDPSPTFNHLTVQLFTVQNCHEGFARLPQAQVKCEQFSLFSDYSVKTCRSEFMCDFIVVAFPKAGSFGVG